MNHAVRPDAPLEAARRPPPLLTVAGLHKSFGNVAAIDDLHFSVDAGAIHAVIGPNGAGKTTLLNMLSGIYTPTRGRVLFDGGDVTGQPPHVLARRGISRTFQNLQIFLNMSAIDNVMVGYHLRCDGRFLPSLLRFPSVARKDREYRERAAALLEYVGLKDYVRAEASAMPYGALKRLELARALAVQPRLLLLDEPAAGLNATETGALDALIGKVADRGVTIVLVEHDMKLVWAVSSRILVLDQGRFLAEGTGEQIRRDPDVVAAYLGERGRHA